MEPHIINPSSALCPFFVVLVYVGGAINGHRWELGDFQRNGHRNAISEQCHAKKHSPGMEFASNAPLLEMATESEPNA